VKETIACPFPGVAVTAVGAPGIEAVGVTVMEGIDGALFPIMFVAVTVNV
jgi:hypothetical protein